MTLFKLTRTEWRIVMFYPHKNEENQKFSRKILMKAEAFGIICKNTPWGHAEKVGGDKLWH